MALSQHGTVAPVTLHHRVDFAASMVDGRTVGEVVPKSHSAREVRELWLYIQDRLSRLTHDARLAPQSKPQHLATSPLTSLTEELTEPANVGEEDDGMAREEPPPAACPGPERRLGADRRENGHGFFGAGERRIHPFGRRASDRNFGKMGTP